MDAKERLGRPFMYARISIKALLVATLMAIVPWSSHATTWASSKVRDPITGQRVTVQEPASSGSYVYSWPEKSDQVFWPYTDSHWLWFNPDSGYIAFGNDFEDLESPQRDALKTWLKANYDRKAPPKSRLELLLWAERVYALRGMDEDFWSMFYRLMAFETQDDSKTSLGYVNKATPLLEKSLSTTTDAGKTLRELYLLSEYNRRLGRDDEAKRYLERLKTTEVNEDLSDFKKYLLEISEAQRTAMPAR